MSSKRHGLSFYKALAIIIDAYRDKRQRRYVVVSFLLLAVVIGLIIAGWALTLFAVVTNTGIWRIVGLAGFGVMAGISYSIAKRHGKEKLKQKDEILAGSLMLIALVPVLVGIYGGPHPNRMTGSLGILCFTLGTPISSYSKKYLRNLKKDKD